jgi:hypothetical protein
MMSMKERIRELEAKNLMLRWNMVFPQACGPHPVRFWTGLREGPGRTGVAYSAATILGGCAGVYIREIVPGCLSSSGRNIGFVCLSHVVPLPADDNTPITTDAI